MLQLRRGLPLSMNAASGHSSPSEVSVHSGQTTDVEPLPDQPMAAADPEKQQTVPPELPRPGPPPNNLYQPKSVKFWLTLLANFLALFLVALDRTIVATAISQISDDFHSLGEIGWFSSAYMLTTSASQLLFGRIYRFYHMKWTFLLCVVVFEIGSAICGAAPNSSVFIFGRAVAGVASAGIFSGCMLIMIPMIPLHKRPMFQGLFGAVFGVASVAGPLIGGAFTTAVSWRWCFYINLPVGAFTLIFMIFFWNPPKRTLAPAPFWTHVKRLDPLGTLFFLPGIVCLLLALQWGGSKYAWRSGQIIALFLMCGALLFAFTVVQVVLPKTATIPGRVIRQRSILSGALFTFFLSASMLMLVYFIPIWFQTTKSASAIESGVDTIPLVLSLVGSSILSGISTQKIGYYVPSMMIGPCIMSVGQGLMSTVVGSTRASHWIAYEFLCGFGLGMGMQIGNLAAQTVLSPEDIPSGVAIMFFVQQLGGSIFTSVGETILSNILVAQLAGIPGLSASEIVSAGTTELLKEVSADYLPQVLAAYNYACTRIFLASMGLAFCALLSSFFMEWRSIKKPPGAAGAGGPPGGPPGGPVLARPATSSRPPTRVGQEPPQIAPLPAVHLETDAPSVAAAPSISSESTVAAKDSSVPNAGWDHASYPEMGDGRPPVSLKILRARQEAEDKVRRARRESESFEKPRRNSARLSKSFRKSSSSADE